MKLQISPASNNFLQGMYDSHKLMYNEKDTIILTYFILESYREAKLNSWEN